MTTQILLLSLLLFFCHFLADYTHLSTKWMLDAKRLGTPILPILAHAGVHTILMGIVLSFFLPMNEPIYWNLLFLQILSHFLIDLWKGKMNKWFETLQDPRTKGHWIIFGFDQFLHAAIITIMIYYTSNQ